MSWVYLFIAIVFEVFGTIFIKLSYGFTKILPSILGLVLYVLCIVFLTMALKKIDLSIAYAVWSGLGTAFIAVVGIFWFQEPAHILKLIFILLIIIGVVGLNLFGEIS